MNLQFITYNGQEILNTTQHIEESRFSNPKSFSEFDVNIISLQVPNMWTVNGYHIDSIDCVNDLNTLNGQIKISNKPVIVFIPQDYNYKYKQIICGRDTARSEPIRNNLTSIFNKILNNSLFEGIGCNNCKLVFENCETLINGSGVNSAFVFDTYHECLTTSKAGNSRTTVRINNVCILSSLDLSQLNIDDFLIKIGLLKSFSNIPDWLQDVCFYNDNDLKTEKATKLAEIEVLKTSITSIDEKLDNNAFYKKLLYTNGEELVQVVFDVLEQMLNCDLNEFEDEKKEDFLIKLKDITFIGEIKGVSTNVKSEHVSQLDVHYQSYMDKLREESTTGNVKALLIINPFKNKPLEERDKVHEAQIKLAERNESLIITTESLLNLYEQFLRKEKTAIEIIDDFKAQTGIYDESAQSLEGKSDMSSYTI